MAGLLPGGPQWQRVDLCRDPLAALWQGPGTLGPSDFGATNVDVPSRFSGELAFKGSFQDVFFFPDILWRFLE